MTISEIATVSGKGGLYKVVAPTKSGVILESLDEAKTKLVATTNLVTPGYFRTMGIPLLAGRDFTAADDARAPKVVVVNATLAAMYPEALGHPLEVRDQGSYTIVGVVGDIQHGDLAGKPEPQVYAALVNGIKAQIRSGVASTEGRFQS